MKYNLFKLYVVFKNKHKFICTYNKEKEIFTEVLTDMEIKKTEVIEMGELIDFYSAFELEKHEDNSYMLDREDILNKYIFLNQENPKKNFDIDEFVRLQEGELRSLDKLRKTNPELAKRLAMRQLKNTGILDDNGKLKPPYDKVFVKKNNLHQIFHRQTFQLFHQHLFYCP